MRVAAPYLSVAIARACWSGSAGSNSTSRSVDAGSARDAELRLELAPRPRSSIGDPDTRRVPAWRTRRTAASQQDFPLERAGHRVRQPIVAADDPVHLPLVPAALLTRTDRRARSGTGPRDPRGRTRGGRGCRRVKRAVRAHAVQPLGDGLPREPAGDGGIPSLVGQAVVRDVGLQQARRRRHRGRTAVNPAAAACDRVRSIRIPPGESARSSASARRRARARATVPLRSDPRPPRRAVRAENRPRTVRTRPPTRSRASTTVTTAPAASRSRAAASPASPAPATITRTPESSRVGHLRSIR